MTRRITMPALLTLAAITLAPPAAAQDDLANRPKTQVVAKGASPDGRITVTVSLDGEGRASYAVARDGRAILNDSRLGFLFTDAPKIDRALALVDTSRDRADTTWRQPWGEWETIRDRHNELTVRLREATRLLSLIHI